MTYAQTYDSAYTCTRKPPLSTYQTLELGEGAGVTVAGKAETYLAEMADLLEYGVPIGDAPFEGYFSNAFLFWGNGKKPNNIVPTRGPAVKTPPKSTQKPGWIKKDKHPHEIKHTPSKSHGN